MKIIKGDWRDKHDEIMEAQNGPFIFINSNGSKWVGQDPDDMSVLYDVLANYKLREDFAEISVNPCKGVHNPKFRTSPKEPQWIDGPRLFSADGVVHFSGNFEALSHVFSIFTNDPGTISKMNELMANNRSRT